ncbi:MAG: HDOD domain-containing protein [Lentisphaeraceae bacterium]|nr:HDOD domain-containing protein [Lentisphaeraceae bacterium]
MGIFSFFSRLFGGDSSESVSVKVADIKEEKPVEENSEGAENSDTQEPESLWWENPIIKDEHIQFDAVTNTVLYDELHRSIKEHRLEIIEIPDNLSAILGILHKKNFQYPEIVDLVEHSPVLTGDFLSVANSAAFSRGIAIRNLTQALPRLGKQSIQSILFLNASKLSVPDSPIFTNVAEEVITESQAVAKIARVLSRQFGLDPNETFLAGLLHNVGKLGLLKQISIHYDLPDDIDVEYHQSLFKNIFPIFHNEAGKIIGQYWKLDSRTIEVIHMHNNLQKLIDMDADSETLRLASLINLSVYISRILGFSNSLHEGADLFNQGACQVLGFEDTPANRKVLNKMYDDIIEVEEEAVA